LITGPKNALPDAELGLKILGNTRISSAQLSKLTLTVSLEFDTKNEKKRWNTSKYWVKYCFLKKM
jgi:hypothetical protein